MNKEPKQRDINEYIQSLISSERLSGRVVHYQTLPGKSAEYGVISEPRPEVFMKVLEKMGFQGLYRHQVEAVNHVRSGRHTAVSTPTASGKSLIYNLPVIERCMARPDAGAVYIFPLKALAQDQLRAFRRMAAHIPDISVTAEIYDGDTPDSARRKIRADCPNILLTNPEMIHLSMLPHHHLWSDFFRRLEIVVVDEVHTYRGVMGSHMAQIFRRFLRICDKYGASPTFVFSSATIANPSQLAEQLTGLQTETVSVSGSPRGKQHLVFLDSEEGPVVTVLLLLKAAVYRGLRTIVYTRSRKLAELISLKAKQSMGRFADRVSAYRAGFLPEERREIERKLSEGELSAVISTSALEMGIDIGDLDLCLLVGYPGSIVATRQRIGRVGRNGQESAFILMAGEDALDQYFLRNPTALLDREPESASANPLNPVILEKHLPCAAAETPLKSNEPYIAHRSARKILSDMAAKGDIVASADGGLWFSRRKSPHRFVDLRGAGRRYRIIDERTQKSIGDIDYFRALEETHPGAVYIHKGTTYLIRDLDLQTATITANRAAIDYYTRIRTEEDTDILEILDDKAVFNTRTFIGKLKITRRVIGYEKRGLYGKHASDFIPLDLPPLIYETEGLWFLIPPSVQRNIESKRLDFAGGIHAAEHAAIGIFPLLVMADRNDLGGLSTPYHYQTGAASIFIYDGIPGGAGLTRSAFERAEQLFEYTKDVIELCPCRSGCPSCVQSPKCGSGNRPIDKAAAYELLTFLKTNKNAISEINKGLIMIHENAPRKEPLIKTPVRYGVFDIETRRSADEVGGWANAAKMGVSCAVLYDSAVDDYIVFLEDQVADLIDRLKSFDLVIGFNVLKFDYKVLSGYSTFPFKTLPTLDLLHEVKKAAGYRRSLDHIAVHTLGVPKSGNGLQAIEWWRAGRMEELTAYCRKDVEITKELYLYGKMKGYVLLEHEAGSVIRVPASWRDLSPNAAPPPEQPKK